jgi:hypothetical protein
MGGRQTDRDEQRQTEQRQTEKMGVYLGRERAEILVLVDIADVAFAAGYT